MAEENASGFLRLFIAIPVPAEVRDQIGRAQSRLQRSSPPGAVRWARADQFHITLKFLGDVLAAQIPELQGRLPPICAACPPLPLSAGGIGFFPNDRKPRVIWTGARDAEGRMADLHRQIDEAAAACLGPGERGETFTGHITLGRFKPGHPAAISRIMAIAADLRSRHFGDWIAAEVELVQSDLGSNGTTHVVIARFPLSALQQSPF